MMMLLMLMMMKKSAMATATLVCDVSSNGANSTLCARNNVLM
jgi:hypothetical protein